MKKISYGYIYLLLIPVFAIIYNLLPNGFIDYGKLPDTFLVNLYYSAVTVTTLGYGDIIPSTQIASILVGLEAVLGVVVIGLFLNQLSHRQYNMDRTREQEKQRKRLWMHECDKMLQYAAVIKRISDEHEEELVDSVKDFILEIDMHDFKILEHICNKYVTDRDIISFRKYFNDEIRKAESQYEIIRQEFGDDYWG